VGLTNAGLNFMYFIFILNLAVSVVGAAYPQFSYVDTHQYPQLNQSLEKVENINPDTPLQWSAYDVIKTFFSNVVGGNYYLWRALGLNDVWANALRVLTYLSYIIVIIAILWCCDEARFLPAPVHRARLFARGSPGAGGGDELLWSAIHWK